MSSTANSDIIKPTSRSLSIIRTALFEFLLVISLISLFLIIADFLNFISLPFQTNFLIGKGTTILNDSNSSLINYDNSPAFEYKMSEGTTVASIFDGIRIIRGEPPKDEKVLVYLSSDRKWIFYYRLIGSVSLESEQEISEVTKGEKLFTTLEENTVIFQVLKVEDNCIDSESSMCTIVNPHEYFAEI